MLIFLASFFVFLPQQPTSKLFISDPDFVLKLEQRVIEIEIENRGDKDIEFQQLCINDTPILTWSPEKIILKKGEDTNVSISYHWLPEEEYIIDVYAYPDVHGYIQAKSPVIEPKIIIEIGNGTLQEMGDLKVVSFPYKIESIATDWIHIILFTYKSFYAWNRPIYVLYDTVFMAPSSIDRASAFTELALKYGIPIQKINYSELGSIARDQVSSIVIFFDPLMDWLEKEVHDALPAVVLDPDKDGHVRDNSSYDKSLLYDWMFDNGLILVTIGSTQPHKYILNSDGRVSFNKDSFKWNDASFFLTTGGVESELLKGNFGIGDFTPTRITSSLGITNWWSLQGFDKDNIAQEGIDFYGYGDYNLLYQGVMYNLTLPAFINVGEGGWLALGDDYNQMSDEKVIHDLIMLLLHAPWDSEWIPYGFYWDNSSNFYQTQSGKYEINEVLSTEGIPSSLVDGVSVRILLIAYNSDYNEILIQENLIDLS